MPSRVSFEWNGDRILERVTEATRTAIDDTTQAADDVASTSHWWRNRTGYGEAHIVTEAAKVDGSTVRGTVGATYSGTKGVRSAFYLLFLEYKTPFLRPAGDATFPTLADRIREKLK